MHRDIKPANIRVLEDGAVKIMDFGIAKLAQQQTGLTQTGMTLGTAAYLSPEQIRGDAMDVRTDIFSFGVLAYELLAYERPFQGEQISAVLYQLLNNDPRPITECWAAAPPEVVELLDRCLQKTPARRFQDGADLLRALEALQRRGRERSDVYGQQKPRAEPPTVRLQSAQEKPDPRRGLDEIDLTGSSPTITDEPALLHSDTPRRLTPRSGARKTVGSSSLGLTLLIGVALVLVAGLGGWIMGNREPDAEPEQSASEPSTEPEVEDVTSGTVTAADGSITPAPLAGGSESVPEAPVVLKGRLLVSAPSWTSNMTVQVGRRGKTWPLTRRRSVRLDPGTYDLHFSLKENTYTVRKSVRASVAEGKDNTVKSPISRPGALTVIAPPGRPQAEVVVAGKALGSTPIRRHLFEPAAYVLEIHPLGDKSDGTLTQNIALKAGQETIVTFDLDSGRVRSSDKALSADKK